MKMLVTKASDNYWFQIKDIASAENLLKEFGPFIFQHNEWYNTDYKFILDCWGELTENEAKQIAECRFNLIIYDDYIE